MGTNLSLARPLGIAGWALLFGPLVFGFAQASCAAEKEKVIIPFDFVSRFDDGRYGEMVGEMIWKKLSREGMYVIPETVHDVRDLCKSNGIQVTPDMPLERVKQIVRKDFDADIAIWGSVERAPGFDAEVYDLVIKCVDFTSADEPKVIYEVSARTNSVSEIPHLYVKQMLDKLYDRKPSGPAPVDPILEENWKKNPNLIVGGDFEKGRNGVPDGWEPRGGQQREPLGNLVRWIPEVGNPSNHVIRLQFPKEVAEAEGVMYYSRFFPIEEGAIYRFQCRWRTSGPTVKVFIKCYDKMAGEYKVASGVGSSGGGRLGDDRYDNIDGSLREVYRSQQNLKGPKNTWNVHTQDFTPRHTKYSPKWGRVMLYGYLTAGAVEFDDIVLKQIAPPSGSEKFRERRHSLASKVTLKEMEENLRRGKEVRERLRRGEEEPSEQK